MAEIAYTQGPGVGSGTQFTWGPISNADTVQAVKPGFERSLGSSLQITGTWNSATATVQVSNDGATWFTESDANGDAMTATDDVMFKFTMTALYVRVSFSGGGGSQSLTANMVMRG